MTHNRHFKRRFRSVKPIVRTAGIAGSALALCAGITYAALQSQKVSLANNTISTASANLQISTDGTNYGTAGMGFDFTDVEPGGDPAPATGNDFYLKNEGTTSLNLRIALSSQSLDNPDHIDLSKVSVIVTSLGNSVSQQYSLLDLAGYATAGEGSLNMSLLPGTTGHYRIQVAVSADALPSGTTTQASIGGFNLVFSGTSVTVN